MLPARYDDDDDIHSTEIIIIIIKERGRKETKRSTKR